MASRQIRTDAGGMDLINWDDPLTSFYTHKDIPSQGRVAGDVIVRRPLVNTHNRASESSQYIAKKQRMGVFTWPPDECMKHEFVTRKEIGKGEHRRMVRDTSVYGCKWCRERQTNIGSEGAGEQGVQEQPSSPNGPGSPSAANEVLEALEKQAAPAPASSASEAATKKYPCPLCEGGADSETGFKTHMTLKHTSTPRRTRGTRPKKASAGKEKK